MSTLKLHYEGWVALPTTFRQKLGLNTGDKLEATLVGDTIVLRPAAGMKAAAATKEEDVDHADATATPVPSALTAAPAKSRAGGKPTAQACTGPQK